MIHGESVVEALMSVHVGSPIDVNSPTNKHQVGAKHEHLIWRSNQPKTNVTWIVLSDNNNMLKALSKQLV